MLVLVDEDVLRPLHVVPLGQVLAVGIEDLDAVVFTIAHEHTAICMDPGAVRDTELARSRARLAPGFTQLAVRIEAVDARVAVPVADDQIAVRRNRQVRWTIERPTRLGDARRRAAIVVARIRRMLGRPEIEHLLAVQRVLADGVIGIVDQVQRVVFAHVHAMRAVRELSFAPRAQEMPVAIVNHHRMVAATEKVDVAFGIAAHARDVCVLVACWKLLPALDELVLERATAHFETHGARVRGV